MGEHFSRVIRNHAFVGIVFVNKGISILSFEMVITKILFCKKSTPIITYRRKCCCKIYEGDCTVLNNFFIIHFREK